MSKAATAFWPVGLILQLFQEAGCDLRVAEPTVTLEDGDCLNVRYLIRADTKSYVPLVDLTDDQFVSEPEVVFWERRLGVQISRPRIH
ncbi:MAG TPA: hypothetical protein VFE10_10390 [Phenylobacterium sp.]|nr:hypothetical protein [Phenylobacterium sp.]